MLPKEDAQILLEALDFFWDNQNASVFGDISKVELYTFLIDYFYLDDLTRIHYYLEQFAAGKITPTTVPQEIIEAAKGRGRDKDMLLSKMESQRSQVRSWTEKIKSAQKQASIQAKAQEVVTQATKKEAEKIPEKIEQKVKPEEKVEINQIKFKVTEEDPAQAGLLEKEKAAVTFRKAAEIASNSEDITTQLTQPSYVLISKGYTSKAVLEKANSLVEGNEKNFLLFTGKTMQEIEGLFPEETERIAKLWGIKNFDIEIGNEESVPNVDLINLSLNSNGAFSAETTLNFGEGFTSSFTGDAIDLVGQQIVSKVSSAVTEKIMGTSVGVAVSNFASRVGTQFGLGGLKIGAGALGAKLGTGLASFGTKLASALPALGGQIGGLVGGLGAKIGAFFLMLANPVVALLAAAVGFIVGKIIQPIIRFIKDNKEAVFGMLAVGAMKGLIGKIGAVILVIFNAILSVLAWPLISVFIGFPVLVVIIFFIINSGAYLTPPPFSLGYTLNCGLDYEPLSFADTSKNIVAQKAYNIVAGGESVGLHRGFWCNWNKSPKYPDLFDDAAFKIDPNPCVGVYTFPGCTGNYPGLQMFWCTYLITKSNREAGMPMANNDDTLVNSETMRDWYTSKGRYTKILDALRDVPANIKQGDTAIIHTSYSSTDDTPRHVAIIWSADSDTIMTIDSNAWYKSHPYTISYDKNGNPTGAFFDGMYIIGIGKQ